MGFARRQISLGNLTRAMLAIVRFSLSATKR
jgi:hypothetical protein